MNRFNASTVIVDQFVHVFCSCSMNSTFVTVTTVLNLMLDSLNHVLQTKERENIVNEQKVKSNE